MNATNLGRGEGPRLVLFLFALALVLDLFQIHPHAIFRRVPLLLLRLVLFRVLSLHIFQRLLLRLLLLLRVR